MTIIKKRCKVKEIFTTHKISFMIFLFHLHQKVFHWSATNIFYILPVYQNPPLDLHFYIGEGQEGD